MIVSLLALIIISLVGIKFGKNVAFDGYISKDRSNAVKGIFILMVFLSHIKGYITASGYAYQGVGDWAFQLFFKFIGQLMVVMFLFYSGYGIMESITRKGESYVKAMPRHRILGTLLNFDVAVCFFLVVNLLLHNEVSVKQFLLSLVGWKSVGNSCWYIFVILICYFVTWLCGSLIKDRRVLCGGVFAMLTLVAIGLYYVKDPWWYNTIWAYPAGMFYSINKGKVEKMANRRYPLLLGLLSLAFVMVYLIPFEAIGFRTNLLSVVFALLVVVLTMRIKIGNSILRWCGEQLFPMYIYQRIPMLVFATLMPSLVANYPLVYIAISLLVAVFLTFCYRYIRISL